MSYKSTQRQVNITVWKEERGWWERLTAQERKPVFLSPDFDRWLDESDAEMEIREKVGFFLVIIEASMCCRFDKIAQTKIMQRFDNILYFFSLFFFKGREEEQTEGIKI